MARILLLTYMNTYLFAYLFSVLLKFQFFWGTVKLVWTVAASFYISLRNVWVFLFTLASRTLNFHKKIIIGLPSEWKMVSYCGFDLHSLLTSDVILSFHVFFGYLLIFGKMSTKAFCPPFNWVACHFVLLSYKSSLHSMGTKSSVIYMICKTFSPIL